MKEACIVMGVGVGLALLIEAVYVGLVFLVNKYYKPKMPTVEKRIIIVHRHYYGRPELDFDLGVKKVDKLRIGDEP